MSAIKLSDFPWNRVTTNNFDAVPIHHTDHNKVSLAYRALPMHMAQCHMLIHFAHKGIQFRVFVTHCATNKSVISIFSC